MPTNYWKKLRALPKFDYTDIAATHKDFLYLRLIGDRSIQEKDFGRIQIDRVLDMQKWVDNLKTVEDEHIKLAIMTANNHYAEFVPGTANMEYDWVARAKPC